MGNYKIKPANLDFCKKILADYKAVGNDNLYHQVTNLENMITKEEARATCVPNRHNLRQGNIAYHVG